MGARLAVPCAQTRNASTAESHVARVQVLSKAMFAEMTRWKEADEEEILYGNVGQGL